MNLPLTDEELASRFVQTRQSAYFEALYLRYYPRVYGFCWQYVRHDEDAQDLTQELFARLLHCLESYARRSSFKTWLLAIVRNTCLTYIRQRNRYRMIQYNTDVLHTIDLPDDTGSSDFCPAQFNAAFQRLPFMDGQLLNQHYCGRQPLRELADQYQISNSAVKMRLLRAKARLREAYRQQTAFGE